MLGVLLLVQDLAMSNDFPVEVYKFSPASTHRGNTVVQLVMLCCVYFHTFASYSWIGGLFLFGVVFDVLFLYLLYNCCIKCMIIDACVDWDAQCLCPICEIVNHLKPFMHCTLREFGIWNMNGAYNLRQILEHHKFVSSLCCSKFCRNGRPPSLLITCSHDSPWPS